MPGHDYGQARAELEAPLPEELALPERTYSQASMLSDILNSYGSEARASASPVAQLRKAPMLEKNEPSLDGRLSPESRPDGPPSPRSDIHEEPPANSPSGSSTPSPNSVRTPNTSPPQPQQRWLPKVVVHPRTGSPMTPHRTAATPVAEPTSSARPRSSHGEAIGQQSPYLKHKREVDQLRRLSGEQAGDPLLEWNTNYMRNVTLRKPGKGYLESTDADASADQRTWYTPQQRQEGFATPDMSRAESLGASGKVHHRSASSPTGHGHRKLQDDFKRLSGGSRSSAVVQATVIFNERRTPKLRHVSKNESLRSSASRNSKRSSLVSDRTSPLADRELLATRPDHWHNASGAPEQHRLKRQREISNLKPPSAPSGNDRPDVDGEQQKQMAATQANREQGILPYPLVEHSQDSQEARRIGATDASNSPDVFHDAASHLTYQPSFESLRGLPRRHVASHDQHPRSSSDQTSASPSTTRKMSFDPAFSRSELFDRSARFSPMSSKSGATEAYEVKEAAAVDIFPHSNGSLLVVDHGFKGTSEETGNGPHKPQNVGQHAATRLESPRTASLSSHQRRDSPLVNPRQAPNPPAEPPLVAVHPPTPAKELDNDVDADVARPTRQASLLKRARHYSDNMIQPIAGSVRRRRQAQHERAESAHMPPRVSEPTTNSSLHPFWKPRRFWNDLEDSDDEMDRVDDNDPNRAAAPHPTEQLCHHESVSKKSWRRGGSLKGFLIGNTLGLERGPTNKRRPVVRLKSPARQEAKNEPPPSSYKATSVRNSARSSGSWAPTGNDSRRRNSSLTRFWDTLRPTGRRQEDAAELRREQLRGNIRHIDQGKTSGLDSSPYGYDT